MKAKWLVALALTASAGWAIADGSDDDTNRLSTDDSVHHSDYYRNHAQEHADHGADHKAHGKRAKPKLAHVIEHLDIDGDGLLNAEEFRMPKGGPGRHRWETLDSNGDGELTRTEVQGHVNQQWQRFESMDSNNDDKVTPTEAQAALFSRLDTNSDGYLDAGELKQMQDERRARHKRH